MTDVGGFAGPASLGTVSLTRRGLWVVLSLERRLSEGF